MRTQKDDGAPMSHPTAAACSGLEVWGQEVWNIFTRSFMRPWLQTQSFYAQMTKWNLESQRQPSSLPCVKRLRAWRLLSSSLSFGLLFIQTDGSQLLCCKVPRREWYMASNLGRQILAIGRWRTEVLGLTACEKQNPDKWTCWMNLEADPCPSKPSNEDAAFPGTLMAVLWETLSQRTQVRPIETMK